MEVDVYLPSSVTDGTYLCRRFWYHSLSTSSQVHDTNWCTATVIRTTLLYNMQYSFVLYRLLAVQRKHYISMQPNWMCWVNIVQVLMQSNHLPESCMSTATLVLLLFVQFQGIMKPLYLLLSKGRVTEVAAKPARHPQVVFTANQEGNVATKTVLNTLQKGCQSRC